MEAALPGWPRTVASGGGGDTGTEEIESSGQEPSTSTGQTVSGENVKHSDCDSDSTNTNVLFLLQGGPGYVCDFVIYMKKWHCSSCFVQMIRSLSRSWTVVSE